MLLEQWVRWYPLQNLSRKYALTSVRHSSEGLKLFLEDDSDELKQLLIDFGQSVLFYMETNETCRVQFMHILNAKYGTEFYGDWTFFQVEQSEILKSVIKDIGNDYSQALIKHFVIIDVDYFVDIIAIEDPIFEWI